MRRATTALATTAFILAGAVSGTAHAADAALKCGDTLTHNMHLEADLHCDTPIALTIGGPGVVLTLNGHTLSGNGTNTGVAFTSSGRITNGTIAGFAKAVVHNGWLSEVNSVQVRQNTAGIAGGGGQLNLRNDTFDGNHVAITLANTGVDVSDSAFTANQQAIVAWSSDNVTVKRSTFRHNGQVGFCAQGIVSVSQSIVVDNDAGLALSQCDGSMITDSRFDNDGVAVDLYDFEPFYGPSLIRRNTFTHNTTGVALDGIIQFGPGSAITDNRFEQNGTGIYSAPSLLCSGPGQCANQGPASYEISRNTFARNTGDGLHLDPGAPPATVINNVAVNNGGWGLFVDMASGSVDGGGNRASGNGEPAQCYGVTCTP